MKPSARTISMPIYHAVRFYENDRSLSQIVADFLARGFSAGDPGIVVATPAHRAAILRELVARSFDVVQLQRSADLVLLDADHTLSTFMTDSEIDVERFKNTMCEAIRGVCRGRAPCHVRIYGQMVDVLWKSGKREAAIRLEVQWNQLAQMQAFSLLCGYAMGSFYKDADFNDICGQHTHVLPPDGTTAAA